MQIKISFAAAYDFNQLIHADFDPFPKRLVLWMFPGGESPPPRTGGIFLPCSFLFLFPNKQSSSGWQVQLHTKGRDPATKGERNIKEIKATM